MTLLETIAVRVKALREEKNWTQIKLAQEAQVGQSAISDIEQAQRMPRGDTLSQIATALDTTTSYLLGEVEEAS
jgi:transcriptional regulator with XRE-family HTH domain